MSHKVILTYFNGRGLGEIPRLLLKEAGVEFEDRRVEKLDELKASDVLAFGQVPLYEEVAPHGTFRIVQSQAIARHIARQHHLYGNSPHDSAKIDLIVDGLRDIFVAERTASKGDDAAKAAFKTDALPKWLGHFEKLLHSNGQGQGYFVGDSLSWADIATFHTFWTLSQLYPGSLEAFPLLKAHLARIGSRPRIDAWVKARPQTQF